MIHEELLKGRSNRLISEGEELRIPSAKVLLEELEDSIVDPGSIFVVLQAVDHIGVHTL